MSCRAKQPPKCSVWLHHSETPASDTGPQTSVSTIAFQILLRDEHLHQVNHRVAGSFDLYTINTLLMVEIVLSNAFNWSYRIWKWVVETCLCVSYSQAWNPFSIPTYCIHIIIREHQPQTEHSQHWMMGVHRKLCLVGQDHCFQLKWRFKHHRAKTRFRYWV